MISDELLPKSQLKVMHDVDKFFKIDELVKYVEGGWLGRKKDRGFYDYRGPEPVPTR